ncbi:YkvA family protein [Vibrio sp. Vb1026]|uniref:YkvA family protein n=1 Tax=unclassified Vibrio TaxID=2614977 RepID=UPI002964F99F|nr:MULTISPECIES: YkvA family protein [unclassified Vibrio]MDW1741854.1 YkvA family protein [Vibrio sp. Vb2531]MDW1873518.1 YkvA family protein [Vibrio sp. Vb1026]MDW3638125.1 YkvA family protein [Vibrio sp. 1291-1]
MTTSMSVNSASDDVLDQTMQAPDEKTFWRKMKGSVKKAGEEIAVMGIKSWLAMADSNTSVRHKAILGGALAYFVLPTDMVPDVLAGVGFTDDMAALTLAANSVGNAITDEHEEQAREKLNSMVE